MLGCVYVHAKQTSGEVLLYGVIQSRQREPRAKAEARGREREREKLKMLKIRAETKTTWRDSHVKKQQIPLSEAHTMDAIILHRQGIWSIRPTIMEKKLIHHKRSSARWGEKEADEENARIKKSNDNTAKLKA